MKISNEDSNYNRADKVRQSPPQLPEIHKSRAGKNKIEKKCKPRVLHVRLPLR